MSGLDNCNSCFCTCSNIYVYYFLIDGLKYISPTQEARSSALAESLFSPCGKKDSWNDGNIHVFSKC